LVEGLKNIYTPEIRVISLGAVTRGAAETAHYAKEFVDPEEELIVTDSDHYFDGAHLEKVIERKTDATAGIIPVFLARNEGIPKWSYSLLDEKSRIVHVAEKDVRLMELGAHANIGAYYFSKAKFFFETAEKAIQNNRKTGERDKAEFYVAPLYQDLIERGEHIEAAIIPEVWGLGTPSDLAYFLEHCKQEKPYN
jgi:dTDP-glucose pyrophosphorylase